jgi:hypothetical protein
MQILVASASFWLVVTIDDGDDDVDMFRVSPLLTTDDDEDGLTVTIVSDDGGGKSRYSGAPGVWVKNTVYSSIVS